VLIGVPRRGEPSEGLAAGRIADLAPDIREATLAV
jgi:hypothetical protein